jgi:hypothetical protein
MHLILFTDFVVWLQASHPPPLHRWSRKKVRLPDDPEPRLLVMGPALESAILAVVPENPIARL